MTREQESPTHPPPALEVVWSPRYEIDIGAHVFPTVKYRMVRDRLVEEGIVPSDGTRTPEPASHEELALVHTRSYLAKLTGPGLSPHEEVRLELPFTSALRDAMVLCCGGTIRTAVTALERGVGVHLGGGFHHAFADHGEGFCLLNDVAVAARVVQARGLARRIAIVDLDVHHGNGTAAIFARDPTVFTFSMHQETNYPFPKPPGDLDVGLADGIGDAEYLRVLGEGLDHVARAARPELVVYLAGADPFREDQLGGLALTKEGLRDRDRAVFEAARRARAGVAVVLAGGYARRVEDTVEIHATTVREAAHSLLRGC